VIATIALFAALGGGYAVAFSGSGTLQKGSATGFAEGAPGPGKIVRTLTGIGSLEAYCHLFSPGNPSIHLRLHNASGEQLSVHLIRMQGEGGDTQVSRSTASVANNTFKDLDFAQVSGEWEIHISPTDRSKAPQAKLDVAVVEPNSCQGSAVTALALNTQQ
jgi:hypothetical protein